MTACLFCGSDVNPARADRLVYEDDEKECGDCGATLIVGTEPIDDDEVDAYWTSESQCRHDKRHNDPCCLCEDEDGIGTGGDEP